MKDIIELTAHYCADSSKDPFVCDHDYITVKMPVGTRHGTNEIEYSFVGGNIQALTNSYQMTHRIAIRDAYYDTEDGLLRQKGFVFRERTEDDNIKTYTIKGKTTQTEDGIPTRLEEERNSWIFSYLRLQALAGLKDQGLVIYQIRNTTREVYPIKGFDMYIDYVTFVSRHDAMYVNVEIELKEDGIRSSFIEFKDRLVKVYGLTEWPHSKTAVGQAIEELGIIGIVGTEKLEKIDNYLKGVK